MSLASTSTAVATTAHGTDGTTQDTVIGKTRAQRPKYACAGELALSSDYVRSLRDLTTENDWGYSEAIDSTTTRILCPKVWLEKMHLVRDTGKSPFSDSKLNLLYRYAAHYKNGKRVREASSCPMLVPEDYALGAAQGIETPFEFRCSVVIRKLPSTSESPVPDPSSAVSTDERPSSGETRSDPLQPGQDINVLVKTEHVDLADSVGTVDEKQAGGEGPIEVVSNRADVRKDELDEVKEAKEAKESETGLKRDGPPMEDESGDIDSRAGKRVRLAKYSAEYEIPHRHDEPPKSEPYSKFAGLLAGWEDKGITTIHLTPKVDPLIVRYMTRYKMPLVPQESQGVIVVLPDTLSKPPTSGDVFDAMVRVESRGYGIAVGEDWMVEVLKTYKHQTPVDWLDWKNKRREARL